MYNNTFKKMTITDQDNMFAVDIQASALKSSFINIGTVSVRNTTNNFVATKLDWSSYKNMVLRVSNSHNQPVTLTFQTQDFGDMRDIAGNPISVTIPAGALEVIITSKELFILNQPKAKQIALKATAATAPTSGNIVVDAYTEPYI
ncbi:hypothetical protein D3C87_971940 [compost metagenome]